MSPPLPSASIAPSSVAAAEPLVDGRTVSAPFVVLAVVVGAWVLTRLTGFVIRRVVRRIADRSLVDPSRWWRTRSRRVGDESVEVGEQRRRQRIDAASRMLNHLVSAVVWVVAAIVAFHVLDVDAAFFLSSAGFLGAAVAIGGQHKVNDYLTGLSVHVEDRYGVGDEVVVEVGWSQPVHAVVDHIGLFSTRLRDSTSTLHLPNSSMAQVRNLSQEAASARFRLKVTGSQADDVADTLRGLAGTSDLTDVVFVGDIASHRQTTGEVEVDVRTARPLDRRAAETLVRRAERALGGE
jgi:small-conductance mechanosensitive channel